MYTKVRNDMKCRDQNCNLAFTWKKKNQKLNNIVIHYLYACMCIFAVN